MDPLRAPSLMASNHQRIVVSGWLTRAGPADMLAADEHRLIPGSSWNVTLQLRQHGVRLCTDQQNVFHVGAPGVDNLSWRVRLSLSLHLLLVILGLARSVVRCFFRVERYGYQGARPRLGKVLLRWSFVACCMV